MIRQPEEALEHIRELSAAQPSHRRLMRLANTLTIADYQELAGCVSCRRPLTSCADLSSRYSPILFQVLLNKALPAMFDETELEDYFFDVLVSMHEDEATWENRWEEELFKEITGSGDFTMKDPGKHLQRAFNRAYMGRFVKRHRYPKQIEDRAVSAIELNQPLSRVYSEFDAKYGGPFLDWLANCVLPRVGEQRFSEYIRAMLEQYAAGLPTRSPYHFVYSRLTSYIFGFSWKPTVSVSRFREKKDGGHPDHYRLSEIFIRECLPYVAGRVKTRNLAFDILQLDEESREAIEEQALAADLSLVPTRIMVAGDAQLPELSPADRSALEHAIEAVDSYMEARYLSEGAPRGPVPRRACLSSAFGKMLKASDANLYRDFSRVRRTSRLCCAFNEHLEALIRDARAQRYDGNAADMLSDHDEVWLFCPNGESFSGRIIDYSALGPAALKQETRSFVQSMFKEASLNGNTRQLRSIPDKAGDLIRLLSKVYDQFGVERAADVSAEHLLAVVSQMSSAGMAYGTIVQYLVSARAFFRFLVHEGRLGADPTATIRIGRTVAHQKTTPEIPEDILVFIENHIDEVRARDCRLMFMLAMETGWRISDIRNVLVEDLGGDPGQDGEVEIKTRTSKTVGPRIKLRLGDKIFAVISPELHREIAAYIEETAAQREMFDVDTLFFSIVNGVKVEYPVMRFNKAINGLLDKYGIKSVCEDYSNFTSKQTRKTVAVELVSSGASPSDVQKQLGHVNSETTERIYAHVRNKKLAELNNAFFQEKFNLLIESGQLDLYTEEERKLLYVDFCVNRREVELGACTKHPSEGRCIEMGNISCASCPKLCTGKAYRARWAELLESSEKLLASFISKYEELGIPPEEYKDYMEYRQEEKLRRRYAAVLDAIDGRDS